MFRRFCEFSALIEHLAQKAPRQRHASYMWNNKLGFVTTCPSNLGTGLKISVILCLPAFRKFMETMQHDDWLSHGELEGMLGSSRSFMTATGVSGNEGDGTSMTMAMHPNNRYTHTQSTLSLATLNTVASTDTASNNPKTARSVDILTAICRLLDLNVRKLSIKAAAAATPKPNNNNANATVKPPTSLRMSSEQETSKYEVSNRLQIGLSEIDIFQRLVDGVTRIIECERMIEEDSFSVSAMLSHLEKKVATHRGH